MRTPTPRRVPQSDNTLDIPRVELTGSAALVTGGGRGIGRLVGQALAGAGMAVGLVARSEDELAESVELIEAAGGVAASTTADVSDEWAAATAIAKLRHELGPVDLLINNAGIVGPVGPAWEVDLDVWWRTMEVNLRGTLLCTQLVLPEMVGRRRGRILQTGQMLFVYSRNTSSRSTRVGVVKGAVTVYLRVISLPTTSWVSGRAVMRRAVARRDTTT